MSHYYVNKNAQSSGEHEVHVDGCSNAPDPENRITLGNFNNCNEALQEARRHFEDVDGCYYCNSECHSR